VLEWRAETALDVGVGLVLLVLGAVSWRRRQTSRSTGLLILSTGVAWLLGDVLTAATFLHRGPLVHLVLAYPHGRPRSRLSWAVVAAAYVVAAVYPLSRSDLVIVGLAVAVAVAAVVELRRTTGPLRRPLNRALVAAVTVTAALLLGPVTRLAGVDARTTVLAVYDMLVLAAVAVLVADLLRGRWAEDLVTGLVLDLGDVSGTAGLRDRLARAVGDPDLVVGYWVPEQQRYVDEDGRPVATDPTTGAARISSPTRVTTPVTANGQPLAVLVHHPQVLADPALLGDVAAAARLAIGNARLQAQVRAQVADVESSRRRLVTAADEERRSLGERLQNGPERRLATVERLLADAAAPLTDLSPDVVRARATVRELALGIHPAALAAGDLAGAIRSLVARSPITVDASIAGPVAVPSTLAVAAYFTCAEALTNVVKYAGVTAAAIRVTVDADTLLLSVVDDGRGGADPAAGTGLRGLADRAEALAGSLTIDSPPGRGTTITLRLPLAEPTPPADPPPHPDQVRAALSAVP
jgi:signal transduction histidine kinase